MDPQRYYLVELACAVARARCSSCGCNCNIAKEFMHAFRSTRARDEPPSLHMCLASRGERDGGARASLQMIDISSCMRARRGMHARHARTRAWACTHVHACTVHYRSFEFDIDRINPRDIDRSRSGYPLQVAIAIAIATRVEYTVYARTRVDVDVRRRRAHAFWRTVHVHPLARASTRHRAPV